jgi:hypothetical protein
MILEMILIFQIKRHVICLLIHLQSQIWITHRVHNKFNVIILIIVIIFSSFDLLFFLLRILHLVTAFSLRFEIRNRDHQLHRNENILLFRQTEFVSDGKLYPWAGKSPLYEPLTELKYVV